MESVLAKIRWLYREFGLSSLYETGRDAWIIILMRCLRMCAYGTNSLTMALFFSALGFSDFYIGLFMSLTLIGDLCLSFFLTLVADGLGRRRVLFAGSLLMVVSGTIFAIFENYWLLLFAAVIGVISATGGDFGPFRAIEESTISHLTTPNTRSDVLSWYIVAAAFGSSIGTESAGRVVHYLQHQNGWTTIDAYHTVFWAYAGLGTINMVLALLLSSKCEINKPIPETEESEVLLDESEGPSGTDEGENTAPVVVQDPQIPKKKKSLLAHISRETLLTMFKLWFLLAVDSLADGMVGYSLTVYYIDQKFELPKSTLGDILSISYLLAACSGIFAGPLAKRLGLINTMVFTHLPSSTAVLLFPLPRGIFLTVSLFFLRYGLNNMDQAPRSAFIAAVVNSEERTAVMGITSMIRTLASTAGPSITGLLAGHDRFWIAFVVAGSLRIAYDLGLWAMFVNMRLYKHEEKGKEMPMGNVRGERHQEDEEELRESLMDSDEESERRK